MKRAAIVVLASLFCASTANAQLHLDASAQLGADKRFATNRPAGADDAGFGAVHTYGSAPLLGGWQSTWPDSAATASSQ